MAYEAEKQRLADLLSAATGINRTWNNDLEREADERAIESYAEVGIGPQPDGSYMGISHPPQIERESRLGAEWAGKGVAEIALWTYFTNDPVNYAATGFMNSAPHKAVLVDPRFKHIGVGVFTHLPSGEPEYMRRWYFIVWLSITIPEAKTVAEPTFSDVPATHKFYASVERMAKLGVLRGLPDGTFRPDASVTRGQMAAFLDRLYTTLKNELS